MLLEMKYINNVADIVNGHPKAILPTPILLADRTPVLFREPSLRKDRSVPCGRWAQNPELATEREQAYEGSPPPRENLPLR